MSAKVISIGLKGLKGYRVQVEVQALEGIESFVIVGLPDASVKESKERVTAALHSMGFPLVDLKVTINLSPTEQRKNGPLFDLAIALGILKSGEFLKDRIPDDAGFIGALSLDSTVLPVEGMIAAILAAKKLRLKKLFLPFDPTIPKVDIEDLELIYIATVQDVVDHLAGKVTLSFIQPEVIFEEKRVVEQNFNQIIGHETAKRALEIAAARERQYNRYGREICNGSVPFEQLISHNQLTTQQHDLQTLSMKQGLSNRVQIKIIRLARTIADLKGENAISDEDFTEAITLRKLNRNTVTNRLEKW